MLNLTTTRSFRASGIRMSHGKPQVGNSAGIVETGYGGGPGTVVVLAFGTKIGCVHIRRELEE